MSATMTYLDALDAPQEAPEEPRRSIHRTKPLYPSMAPSGESWEEHAAKRRAATPRKADDETELDELAGIVVLEPAYEVPISQLKGNSASLAKRFATSGWDVKAQRSLARIPPKLYMNDSEEGTPPEKAHRKGDVWVPEYDSETTCLFAVKRGGGTFMAMEATWRSKGGFRGARTFDPWLNEEIRRGYLKHRPLNKIEIAEGITPPMGLLEWAKIVAPLKTDVKKQPTESTEKKEETWQG